MGLVEDIDRFRELLSHATESVGRNYFMLPVADATGGEPLIQYRERVYAYELYHRLRCIWPYWPYSLGGELDKRGHPVVRGARLDNVKPDLLVHVPGKMDHNLVVVEIKAARPRPPADERVAVSNQICVRIKITNMTEEKPPEPSPDEDQSEPPVKEPPTEEPPVEEPPPKNRRTSQPGVAC